MVRLGKGVFDGGFLSEQVLQRYNWVVTPFPEPIIRNEPLQRRRTWMKYVNHFILTIRAPRAEGGFAQQVNLLKLFEVPWRFDLAHTQKVKQATALFSSTIQHGLMMC